MGVHKHKPKVVLAGGTGFLGQALCQHFEIQGYNVIVLSRRQLLNHGAITYLEWDGSSPGIWKEALEGASLLINLTGRSVNCRYHETNRREILESRIHATQILGETLQQLQSPPPLWINASSATIYRHAMDRQMDEETGELGEGFSVNVCQQWERTFQSFFSLPIRHVALRIAMVFGPEKRGVADYFIRLTKLGLGGKMGSGNQYVSWLHITDFIRIVQWIVDTPTLNGPINCCAPHPLPNSEVMAILRDEVPAQFGIPTPRWMLELGAFFLRTETELLLKSRRVVPKRLLDSGFTFTFPQFREAIRNIVQLKHQ
jgi:uncharacterized protein